MFLAQWNRFRGRDWELLQWLPSWERLAGIAPPKTGASPSSSVGAVTLPCMGQAGRHNRVGNPYPLPLPSEGRVPNPRGKADFGPSRDTESPAEGGSVLLVLWSQAGTSYEGYVMGLAPRNAPLCHQMLQSWCPLHRYPSISLCLTFSWTYFSHRLYSLFILATTSLTAKMYTSQQCKVLISIKAF